MTYSAKLHRHRRYLPIIILVLITLAAVLIRLAFLSRPMFYDEALSYLEYATISLPRLVARYNTPNNHIFHSLLIWISTRAFNDFSPLIIRLPVFLAGIACIPLSYFVAARFYTEKSAQFVGLITAALLAVSLPMIDYSVNARGYMIQMVIMLLILLIAHHLKTRSRWWLWIALGGLAALGFWTIPTFVYPMGMIAAWLFISILLELRGAPRTRALIGWAGSLVLGAALTFVLYLPVIQSMGINALVSNEFVRVREFIPEAQATAQALMTLTPAANLTATPITDTLTEIPLTTTESTTSTRNPILLTYARAAELLSVGIPIPMLILLAIASVIGLVFHRRLSSDHFPVILAAFLWIIPLTLVYPVLLPTRIWIFLIPVVAMLAASGIIFAYDALWSLLKNTKKTAQGRRYTLVLSGVTVLITLVLGISVAQNRETHYGFQTGYAPQAESIALRLNPLLGEDDLALIRVPFYAPVKYYMERSGRRSTMIYSDYDGYPYFLRDAQGRAAYLFADWVANDDVPDAPVIETYSRFFDTDLSELNASLTLIEAYETGELYLINFDTQVDGLTLLNVNFESEFASAVFTNAPTARLVDDDQGGQALRIGRENAHDDITLSPGRGDYWTDYIVTARVNLREPLPNGGDALNLSLRGLQGTGEYRFSLGGDEARLTAIIAGEPFELAVAPFTLEADRWYAVRLRVYGDLIELYVDDALIVSATDDRLTRGTARIRVMAGAVLDVDDLRIVTEFP